MFIYLIPVYCYYENSGSCNLNSQIFEPGLLDMTEKYKLIKSIIEGYAGKIGVPYDLLPLYGKQDKKVDSYIEIDKKNAIHYVVRQNRFRVKHMTSPHLKHILFDVFDRVTFIFICDQFLKEKYDKDTLKAQVLEKQKELLNLVNEEYVGWCKAKDCKTIAKRWKTN